MKHVLLITILSLLFSLSLQAADPSNSEFEGSMIARKILMQQPEASESLNGTLTTKSKAGKKVSNIRFNIQLNTNGWITSYTSTSDEGTESIAIHHSRDGGLTFARTEKGNTGPKPLPFSKSHSPFAGSAYWASDLAYPKCSFFIWPNQKLLKKELRRGQSCYVLESTHHSKQVGEYARAVSWIDIDTLGPVEVHTYDMEGNKWKEFRPKSFKKVNGQYKVEELEIRDRKNGSRSTIEFDY